MSLMQDMYYTCDIIIMIMFYSLNISSKDEVVEDVKAPLLYTVNIKGKETK